MIWESFGWQDAERKIDKGRERERRERRGEEQREGAERRIQNWVLPEVYCTKMIVSSDP